MNNRTQYIYKFNTLLEFWAVYANLINSHRNGGFHWLSFPPLHFALINLHFPNENFHWRFFHRYKSHFFFDLVDLVIFRRTFVSGKNNARYRIYSRYIKHNMNVQYLSIKIEEICKSWPEWAPSIVNVNKKLKKV